MVAGAQRVQVVLHRPASGRPLQSLGAENQITVPAVIAGTAPDIDLALLKVDLTGLPALALADATPVPNKGDNAWMLVATLLVILMTVPGLALFYGGLVRSKNILSVLMQVMVTFSLIVGILWALDVPEEAGGANLPAVALVGAPGMVIGVTLLEASEAGPVPAQLVAVTVKV